MRKELSIKEEFDKEFIYVHGTDCCLRKKILKSNGKAKTVIFRIACIDIAPVPLYQVYLEESNEILKEENKNFNEERACYEWTGSSFEKVNCEK